MTDIIEGESFTPIQRKPSESITMSFPDAMREIIAGKKVTRVGWGNSDYGLMRDGWLTIFTKGDFHTWTVNDGDTDAQDWIVLEEGN